MQFEDFVVDKFVTLQDWSFGAGLCQKGSFPTNLKDHPDFGNLKFRILLTKIDESSRIRQVRLEMPTGYGTNYSYLGYWAWWIFQEDFYKFVLTQGENKMESKDSVLDKLITFQVDESLFKLAHLFCATQVDSLKKIGIQLPPPDIASGPNGSVDLCWQEEQFKLLINLPSTGNQLNFYGKNKSVEVKGTILDPTADHKELFLWLMR